MKNGRLFFDSNILLYADDLDAIDKAPVAQQLLYKSINEGTGVLSTQVLCEYFSVATRKLHVDKASAQRKVRVFCVMDVVLISPDMIQGAIDLHRLQPVSFWDALIVKAAASAGCKHLYSEDLQHGQTYDGVKVINPFV